MKAWIAGIAIALCMTAHGLSAQQGEMLRVNVDRANMRSAASIDSAIVRSASRGTLVTVLARDGAWVRVQLQGSGVAGWVRRDLLIAVPAGSATAVAPPPPAPAPRAQAPSQPASPSRSAAPPPSAPPSSPMATQSITPGVKDPGTATLIGVLIPGGGQLYSGDTGRGFLLLGAGLGAPILGCGISGSVGVCELGLVAGLGVWVYGIVDAGPSARRMNAKNGYHVAFAPIIIPARQPRVGLAVRVTF